MDYDPIKADDFVPQWEKMDMHKNMAFKSF
jgi:hypothetical protein